jgi:hypothetical protein
MKNRNPYEPPPLQTDQPWRFQLALSSTEVFTIGAIVAVIVLLFAPGQPHPAEYTQLEKILIALTKNWLTFASTILGFGTLLTAAYHLTRIVRNRFR